MDQYVMGDSGPAVIRIQKKLKELSLYGKTIDGEFGQFTWEAVVEYQKAKDLDVDGVVGPQTWGSLFDGEPITPREDLPDEGSPW
ncbi:MAG: peptidoglycan-binding domain-containing protein [Deltaproteobacteria bacterium]